MRLCNAAARTVATACLILALPAVAGSGSMRGEHSEATLLISRTNVAPAAKLRVALRLKHDAGWHSYWINPGDSGLATRLRWHLPDGWQASDIEWPTPHRFALDGIHNFGYDGEIDLTMTLQVPASANAGESVTLQADARWLVCKDICVSEKAQFSLTLHVADDVAATPDAELWERIDASLPTAATISAAHVEAVGDSFDFRLEDLPASFTPDMHVEIYPRSTRWLSHRPLSAVVGEKRQLEFVAARNDFYSRWPEHAVLLLKPVVEHSPSFEVTLDIPPPEPAGDAP